MAQPSTTKAMDKYAMEQSERLLAEDETVWEETGRLTLGGSEREELAAVMKVRGLLKSKQKLGLHLDEQSTVYERQETPPRSPLINGYDVSIFVVSCCSV